MSFSNTDTGSKTADPYTAKNKQEPSLKEKVDDFANFVDRSKFCMMTTKTADGLLASRCMAVAAKEVSSSSARAHTSLDPSRTTSGDADVHCSKDNVDFIFHANSESGKTDDLDANPDVNLGFLTNSGEWASVSGHATIETDREKVRKYYSAHLKAWMGDLGDGKHDGGPDDPRIVVIKVKSKTVQYAISRRTAIGGAIEMAKGVVTGEAPQVNKLRHLSEEELQQSRSA
jgi:general stress protein 26